MCCRWVCTCFLPAGSKKNSPWIDHALDVALYQAKEMSALMTDSLDRMPRTLYTGYNMDFLVEQMECDSTVFMDSLVANPPASEIGKLRTCNLYDWTSGFFPGTLWYLYELTGNDTIRQEAVRYTNRMYPIRKVNDNHDIGFMMNCSYGNALRLDANDTIKAVLIETADNLCSRFNAIRLIEYPEIDPYTCRLCGTCVQTCPAEALQVDVPGLLLFLRKSRKESGCLPKRKAECLLLSRKELLGESGVTVRKASLQCGGCVARKRCGCAG